MLSTYEIRTFDIEVVGSIIRGVLNDPDLVTDAQFENVIEILEIMGNATIYAVFPATTYQREVYLDALAATWNKLFHSYKVNRAYP